MIKPAIKLGQTGWKQRLSQSGAKYSEVWYHAGQPASYQPLFSYLTQKGIHTGLHFWAIVDNIWEPNIAYPGPIRRASLQLIQQTITTAARHRFAYVNIHPGNRCLIKLNLARQEFIPQPQTLVSLQQSTAAFTQSIRQLQDVARRRGVRLFVETMVSRTSSLSLSLPHARRFTTDYFSLPVASLIQLAPLLKLDITNDLGHTFCDEADKPLPELWQALWRKTRTLLPYTRLLHINTVAPPFTGLDSHDGITPADFARNPQLFPPPAKLRRLLGLFHNRRRVIWAVNEPANRHAANYRALVKLLIYSPRKTKTAVL